MPDKPEFKHEPGADFTCPVAAGLIGTDAIGVIARDGVKAAIDPEVTADEVFRETKAACEHTEKRFRFAYRCIEHRCPQWTGAACGMIDRMLQEVPLDEQSKPRHCTIRPTCRWFSQSGWNACRVCPFIITDTDE